MRRSSFVAIIALLLLTLAGGSVATAQHGSGSGGSGSGGGSKTVELRIRASAKAQQGHTLRIRAKARHADHGSAISAQAVVHFASGDVTVDLIRHGHSRELKVRVPVAADEALGPITIDVIVTIDSVAWPMATVDSTIVPPSLDD